MTELGEDFFHIVSDCYYLQYSQVVFSDFLWTMRSIYLPLFHTLKMKIPKADLYHCVATGYAGVLGGVIVMATMTCVINLLVDILYAFIDPRIKAQYTSGGKKKKVKKTPAIANPA